ncbi:MAG: bifunctional phosphoglucose/phosphomannose isomerase [Thermacetogeniaceae bacterium]
MNWEMERVLDEKSILQDRDPDGMLETLAGLPEQCEEALLLGDKAPLPSLREPRQVVMGGLGGSAIGGDLVRVLVAREARVPVVVIRDYLLPGFVDGNTLVFLTSYSGNTEETLSAYRDAGSKGAERFVLTTGGALAEYAQRDGVPWIRVPLGLPPRSAVGYLSLPVLKVLSRLGIISFDRRDERELVETLREMRKQLGPWNPCQKNPAKALALSLYGKIPVVYGTAQVTEAAAVRWKGQINENAKALAYYNILPEMNHNEIVGFEAPGELLGSLAVIFLRDKADHPRVQARIEITKSLLKGKVAEIREYWGEGESLLSRLFSLICLGDYTSVYLALLYGINPKPVAVIDRLKRELKGMAGDA